MSDREKPEDLPEPARGALDNPRLTAEQLTGEVGDSEPWDEASEEDSKDTAERG